MKDGMVLQDQLSGAEVPPEVGIAHAAHRHGEQAESEDDQEYPAGLQQPGHRGGKVATMSTAAECTVSGMDKNRAIRLFTASTVI